MDKARFYELFSKVTSDLQARGISTSEIGELKTFALVGFESLTETPTPEEQPPYDEMSVYLKKDNEIVGIHAIGEKDTSWQVHELDGTITQRKGFQAMDIWGNQYNSDLKMIGKGSFRVHNDIETEVNSWKADGWVAFEPVVK